jgi:CheY-like chemotaxis protein
MSQAKSGASKRVLVVDDDPLNRKLVAACLRDDALIIDEAADGESALEMVFERRPDLVILDLELPRLDGFAIARMIRMSGGECAHVPIIAFSASADRDARTRCADAGTTDYLSKPLVDPSSLRDRVRAHLSGIIAPPPSFAHSSR